MASYFDLELDTTGPQDPFIEIEGGNSYTAEELVDVLVTTSSDDVLQFKIWGDVDKSNDTDVQTQEEDIADPDTAPTLSTNSGSSGLTAGDYFVTYTWTDNYGETLASPEEQITISDDDEIVVDIPSFPNGNNISANVYISDTSGEGYLQENTESTSFTQDTTLDTDSDQLPSENDLTGSAWKNFDTEGQEEEDTLEESLQVMLSPEEDTDLQDETKTLYVRFRDDVHNESDQADDSIYLDTTKPTVTIMSGPSGPGPDTKISKVDGMNTAEFDWEANHDISEYTVQVVSSSGDSHTEGTQLPEDAGSTNMEEAHEDDEGLLVESGEVVTSTIYGADLEEASPGDGEKTIKVFVRDRAGNWST